MKDAFGRELVRGDYFIFAQRIGNSAVIKVGIVKSGADNRSVVGEVNYDGEFEIQRRLSCNLGEDRIIKVDSASLPTEAQLALFKAIE